MHQPNRSEPADQRQYGPCAHVPLATAFASGADAISTELFRHGTLQVKLYAPRGQDDQTPHSRDELYVIARGRGQFYDGEKRVLVETGDLLFAPAGRPHRFEDFTDDFATWVMFYGPEGGEVSSP